MAAFSERSAPKHRSAATGGEGNKKILIYELQGLKSHYIDCSYNYTYIIYFGFLCIFKIRKSYFR